MKVESASTPEEAVAKVFELIELNKENSCYF